MALDRWEESGVKLPYAKVADRLAWMREQYGYRPEEVQSWYLARPPGWVYDAVHQQRRKESAQRKKEKAS